MANENDVGNAKQALDKNINYFVFKELFKELDINPYEFYLHSKEHVSGWFPDLPERKSKINVKKLAKVIWREGLFN